MENASKALLIAGGALIAILLLTLFAYLFSHMAESTSSIYDILSQSEIAEFNQQFLNYEGRGLGSLVDKPLTIQDVATLINLAQDNNEKQKFPTTVAIYLNSYGGTDLADTQNYFEWLRNNQTLDIKYNCKKVHVETKTLLVDYVLIEQRT